MQSSNDNSSSTPSPSPSDTHPEHELDTPPQPQPTTFDEDDLCNLINDCLYIKTCSSNKKKDICSLSYLIDRSMSQSDCIKLGLGCEKVFSDMVMKYTSHKNIKGKNIKGKKEKDHLFCDEDAKIVYYAELKANINLDTEKSKSTYEKCLQIVEALREEYPDYEIKWCLLAFRFTDYTAIPETIQKKYSTIKDNLFGINQYLKMLGIEIEFTEDGYKKFLNKIADSMFCE